MESSGEESDHCDFSDGTSADDDEEEKAEEEKVEEKAKQGKKTKQTKDTKQKPKEKEKDELQFVKFVQKSYSPAERKAITLRRRARRTAFWKTQCRWYDKKELSRLQEEKLEVRLPYNYVEKREGDSAKVDYPVVHNVCGSAYAGTAVDLKTAVFGLANAEPHPVHGIMIRLRNPSCTANISRRGEVTARGCSTEYDCRVAIRMIMRKLQRLNYNVRCRNFKFTMFQASGSVPFGVSLGSFARSYPNEVEYEPHDRSAACYRMLNPKVTVNVHSNGKLLFMGARSRDDIHTSLLKLYPKLYAHRLASFLGD